jgi:hypothetical protein
MVKKIQKMLMAVEKMVLRNGNTRSTDQEVLFKTELERIITKAITKKVTIDIL